LYYCHKKLKKKKTFLVDFLVGFYGLLGGIFWVGFLLPTLPSGLGAAAANTNDVISCC
jgi:hypothetical protein